MITQNPIIGRARKKVAGIYARTLYGKNVLQSCPPPTKGKQTANQVAVCSAFGKLSRLANQVDASLLTYIYYAAPQGRSRRAQWCRDLAPGVCKGQDGWQYDPALIEVLGSNPQVTDQWMEITPNSTSIEIELQVLSAIGNADQSEKPCLILICPSDNICISLLPYTVLNDDVLNIQPLSTTLLGKLCYIFPLWQVNVGTMANPIMAYGSYKRNVV